MRALKLSILFAICAIIIPLGIRTFADDPPRTPPPTTKITASYGSTHTVASFADAERKFSDHEGRLATERTDKLELNIELGIIHKGIGGDRSGLNDAAAGIGITVIAGGKLELAAVVALANKILNLLDEGKDFDIHLTFINKWAEIESNDQDIANAFSDRDLFYELYEDWWIYENGPNNPVPPKHNEDSLSSMQTRIPPIGVRCGGACNDWWYNGSNWFLDGDTYPATDPVTGRVGVSASLSEMSTLAEAHKKTCEGCNVAYWTCRDSEERKHKVLYCHKKIEKYTYDQLGGNWGWFSLGICGESYRRCDDPKKKQVHRYNYVSGYNSEEYGGYYIASYRSQSPSNHGSGSGITTPPAVSIYGRNGVGFSSNAFDVSPRCDTCVDNSSNCPDSDTNH